MATATLTDAGFATGPAAVPGTAFLYVWAPWCGPCKMVKPHYLALAEERADEATFFDADLQEFEQTAQALQIKATPTLIAFRDGVEVDRRTGAMMRAQLQQWADGVLSAAHRGSPRPARETTNSGRDDG